MKVRKTELKERQFTPYEITITVESEADHEELKKDIYELDHSSRHVMSRLRRQSAITDLINEIRSHTK